ncbi:MAG TPA: hypothetical protein VHO48_02190, partial [Anaerolineaceae bacterium]|nr:hypothetical protein [Anaerolineaceae bacterium]
MPSRLTDTHKEPEGIRFLLPWVGLFLGVLLVGSAYRDISIAVPIPPLGRYSLGLAVFYIPSLWRILSMSASRNERAALLVASALFSQLPGLLLCPEYFCTYEELGWWRAVQDLLTGANMLDTGSLGVTSNVYPAMPLLAAVVQNGAGLSTYATGLILSAIFRVIALLGIFLLGERVFLSTRAGAVAALLFLIHPAFFTSPGFSADSFGLALMVTALLAAHYAAEGSNPDHSAAWSLVNLGLTLVLAMTQPTTGLVLALILAAMTAAERWLPHGAQAPDFRPLGKTAGLTFLISTTWLLAASPSTLTTLLAHLRTGWLQVQSIFQQQVFDLSAARSLLVLTLLLGALSLIGLRLIQRNGLPLIPAAKGLLASGFVSLALLADTLNLTSPFLRMAFFIGIALLAGLAVAWLTAPKRAGEPVLLPIARQLIALVAFAVVLGGLVVPTTPSWRYLKIAPSADEPAFTRENVDAARWMLTQAGPGNRILGDQTPLRVFGSLGMQDPVSQADPRAWNALSTVHTSLQTLLWLSVSEAPYLVLDERQSDPLDLAVRANPAAWKHDPLPSAPSAPNPREVDLDKEPLLARVYDSGQVRIYHLPMAPEQAQTSSNSPADNSRPDLPEYDQASSIPLAAARV